MKTRFRCIYCKRLTRGRKPRGGDGSFYYPSLHKVDRVICPGVYEEAEWVGPNEKSEVTE